MSSNRPEQKQEANIQNTFITPDTERELLLAKSARMWKTPTSAPARRFSDSAPDSATDPQFYDAIVPGPHWREPAGTPPRRGDTGKKIEVPRLNLAASESTPTDLLRLRTLTK